ncbi:UNVERIFIED_CONTAM: hypothetical protein Scaly_2524700 [Sesamum calycinum]|uniref:Endonuclease/exonuclease/phosphatase n=1 Tax=Sesamum calycinum TaxID=2727403 RepID=A0AAW2LVM1_9LAMI
MYERLQNFYYLCRQLGHISASSELRFEKGFQDPGKATTYGALLRAPPRSWGVRKPWKTTDSLPVRRNLPSYIAEAEVFGRFATIHELVESSARRGKGIIHAESEDAHRKVGEGMVDDVHFASSDGLGSHVPETGIPIDNDLAMSEDEAVNPSLGGCWESIGSLCSSSALIGINLVVQYFSLLHIDTGVFNEAGTDGWRFTGIYGQPDATKRAETWCLLRSLDGLSARLWLCAGDFNEKIGTPRPRRQIKEFRACLADCQLMDLGYLGSKFTWCNQREAPNIVRVRLDRADCSIGPSKRGFLMPGFHSGSYEDVTIHH